MKSLLTWVVIMTTSCYALCQNSLVKSKTDCAAATQRHIEQNMTLEQQIALQNNPEQLAVLNYVYASSYTFSSDQMILKSQKALFDLKKYERFRQQSCNTTVYDDVSGLNVTLLSWDEVDKQISKIKLQYQMAECASTK